MSQLSQALTFCGVEHSICKFADDTKLGLPRKCCWLSGETLQKYLNRLEHWIIINEVKFNKSKYQILHPGQTERGVAGEQACRKRSGVAAWQQDQCESAVCPGIQEVKPHPGVHQISITNPSREAIMPLYSALVRPHLDGCMQCWVHNLRRILRSLYVSRGGQPRWWKGWKGCSMRSDWGFWCLVWKEGDWGTTTLFSTASRGEVKIEVLISSEISYRPCGNSSELHQGIISLRRRWWNSNQVSGRGGQCFEPDNI